MPNWFTHSTGYCSAEDPNSVLSKETSGASRRLSARLDLILILSLNFKTHTGKDADFKPWVKNCVSKNCWLAKTVDPGTVGSLKLWIQELLGS